MRNGEVAAHLFQTYLFRTRCCRKILACMLNKVGTSLRCSLGFLRSGGSG